jgi:hypothetical protein
MFTTTSRDADMAGDERAAQRESILADARKPPDKSTKAVHSSRGHKHKWRMEPPSIPSRADTNSEEGGKP